MKSITKYVAKQFKKPTGIGGVITTFLMNRQNWRLYEAVFDNIHIQPSDTVLDIGFGNGYMMKELLKRSPKRIYGIDISEDMVARVTRNNKTAIQAGTLHLQSIDVKKMPFEDALFDKIYTVNTLYFWDETEYAFSEIQRVLKPGGIFLNVIYSKEFLDRLPLTQFGYLKYTINEVREMTVRSGLKIMQIIEIQPNVSFCVIAEKPCDMIR